MESSEKMDKITDNRISCRQDCPALRQMNLHYHYFVSRLSHEIRNPLTLVCSSLQLMEKEQPALRENALWDQVKDDLKDTLRLLEDLSSLNQSASLRPESLDPGAFLQKVGASCRPFLAEQGISFSVAVPPGLPRIQADRSRLREALLNLIRNGADALQEQSGERRLRLTVSLRENTVCFHVKDNGPGIPSEYRDTILDPFVTHKARGTGLGLAIAKSVARSHGGTLSFTTSTHTPGSFTEFCLRLPCASSHPQGEEPA